MKNLVWEYDALPHALIAGGTGGGKTYFLLTLIEALLHTNAVLYILDPKNGDLGGNERNNWRRNNIILVRPADRCCRV